MQQKQSATKSPKPSSDSRGDGAGSASPISRSPFKTSLVNMVGLAVFDALALYIMWSLVANGKSTIAIVVLVVTALINWIFLSESLYPIRWLTPGLILLLLMVVYPLLYTVYVGFTNYSDGHLLSKEQVVNQITSRMYQPGDAANYDMIVYRSADDQFLLLLKDPQGNYFVASQAEGVKPFTLTGEPPAAIGNYQKVPNLQVFQYLTKLSKMEIKSGGFDIKPVGTNKAQAAVPQYSYDAATDTITDKQTGNTYKPVQGTFVDAQGKPIQDAPGFATLVGFANFTRVVTDRNIRGPFFQVFVWTLLFALFSVLLNFSLGLGFALVFNDPRLPFKGMFRSFAIIPYTIPGFISVLMWVGLLNPIYGPFNMLVKSITGYSPEWFSNGTLTKVAILFINMWLGYPYMMLITLGALQSIPTDMYEAANLDGAGPFATFRFLTLPLLLISVGPLLIGTFAYNFNNFTIIDLVNQGGPPIAGANTPAGQTDILISYTYRLAFAGGRGADFGLASAIAIFIFILVASLTAFNFRFTKQLEEVMR